MKTVNNVIFRTLFLALVACTSPQKTNEQAKAKEENSGISLTKSPPSPDFPMASLTLEKAEVEADDTLYTINYDFKVENYTLGIPTADADTKGIANSDKGQHIHYIVNNGSYVAHYMSGVSDQLQAGNYVVLAFLSRSYHESLKTPRAYHIENITIGDVKPDSADLKKPYLFYSRPKGTYVGNDTQKIMLDFYLLNTTISPEGNKVKATINDQQFIIEEWTSHFIEGLPMGENRIKLELIDAQDQLIDGAFNVTERTIKLVAE